MAWLHFCSALIRSLEHDMDIYHGEITSATYYNDCAVALKHRLGRDIAQLALKLWLKT